MHANRSSLVKKFSLLLILSAVAGAVTYICLFFYGQFTFEKYIEHSSFIETRSNKRIKNFQSYIFKNNISTLDSNEISEWGKRNAVVLMEIYRGHYLLYSTVAPEYFYEYKNQEEATMYDWVTYHTVTFADGDAQVLVYADDMTIWNFWLILTSTTIGVLVALIIFLTGCNRVVKQICILNERIQMMEAGDLNVDIPFCGNHELGQLAQSLNSMQFAFKAQIENEKAIFQTHQTIITEMSHDLRTPLTTLQIYTDILRYKKYDPSMLENHLELIDAKAYQIKQLADNIFEYSLISKQEKVELETPSSAKQVFYDMISEYIYQWEKHGILLDYEFCHSDVPIAVYSPYIKRSLDNISSNIIKYASRDERVLIKTYLEQNYYCITVQNKISKEPVSADSSHIGLSNIEMMMKKMNGKCITQLNEEHFSITLLFPAVNITSIDQLITPLGNPLFDKI